MKINHKSLHFFLLAILGLCSCEKDPATKAAETVEDKLGNANLIWSTTGPVEVKDLGMTIHASKLWQSRDNSQSSGLATVLDGYILELWFDLEKDNELAFVPTKEKKSASEEDLIDDGKRRYAAIGLMRRSADGFLYVTGGAPGTTTFAEPTVDPMTSDGLFSYTVTDKDGLIFQKFPALASWIENTGDVSDPTTVTELIQAHEVEDSGWENAYRYDFSTNAIVSRVRYEENSEFKTKAKLGCLVKKVSGDRYAARSFLFDDVELGAVLQNSEDLYTQTESESKLGDDDALWIKWTETYYLAGIDLNTRNMRIMRTRSAPYYTARELPGVDSSVTSPKVSGLESLVRSCNKAAGVGGTFHLSYLSGSESSLELEIGAENDYCASLATASSATLDYQSSNYGACSFTIVGAQGGTWNGSEHSGPVTDAGGSISYQEYSPITDVSL
jgi:hypothetical protein